MALLPAASRTRLFRRLARTLAGVQSNVVTVVVDQSLDVFSALARVLPSVFDRSTQSDVVLQKVGAFTILEDVFHVRLSDAIVAAAIAALVWFLPVGHSSPLFAAFPSGR